MTMTATATKTNTTKTIVESTLERVATIAGRVADLNRSLAGKRELKALSNAQLDDAGIDRSVRDKGPVYEVDVVTMTTLMSLR